MAAGDDFCWHGESVETAGLFSLAMRRQGRWKAICKTTIETIMERK